MGLRFRKSFKVAPGVRVNVGKKSVGISAGVKGFRVSKNSSGRTTVTSSIPGTGVSYQKQYSNRSKTSKKRSDLSMLQAVNQQDDSVNQAIEMVNAHDELIFSLTSLHENAATPIDWISISQQEDYQLDQIGPSQEEALSALNAYKPSWRDKLFNRVQARKDLLNLKLNDAKELDREYYQGLNDQKELAIKVLQGDMVAWLEAFQESHTLNEESFFGIDHSLFCENMENASIHLSLPDQEIVPKDSLTLTASQKLSEKPMGKTRYLELYKSFIISSVLRAAKEVFAILPVTNIKINVYDIPQADQASEKACIFSIRMNRDDIDELDLEETDLHQAIEGFEHNMNHLKTKGFRAVEELV